MLVLVREKLLLSYNPVLLPGTILAPTDCRHNVSDELFLAAEHFVGTAVLKDVSALQRRQIRQRSDEEMARDCGGRVDEAITHRVELVHAFVIKYKVQIHIHGGG